MHAWPSVQPVSTASAPPAGAIYCVLRMRDGNRKRARPRPQFMRMNKDGSYSMRDTPPDTRRRRKKQRRANKPGHIRAGSTGYGGSMLPPDNTRAYVPPQVPAGPAAALRGEPGDHVEMPDRQSAKAGTSARRAVDVLRTHVQRPEHSSLASVQAWATVKGGGGRKDAEFSAAVAEQMARSGDALHTPDVPKVRCVCVSLCCLCAVRLLHMIHRVWCLGGSACACGRLPRSV